MARPAGLPFAYGPTPCESEADAARRTGEHERAALARAQHQCYVAATRIASAEAQAQLASMASRYTTHEACAAAAVASSRQAEVNIEANFLLLRNEEVQRARELANSKDAEIKLKMELQEMLQNTRATN